jgi:hypothetical protein
LAGTTPAAGTAAPDITGGAAIIGAAAGGPMTGAAGNWGCG